MTLSWVGTTAVYAAVVCGLTWMFGGSAFYQDMRPEWVLALGSCTGFAIGAFGR